MSGGTESAKGLSMIPVRGMNSSDAAAIVAILRESPEASPWSENSILESASQGMSWVAEQDGVVAGFLIGRAVADEFEILNMAVTRAYRRRGIGERLVREVLERSRMAGAARAHLEVRASNHSAITLYIRHGFVASGRRGEYYQHPAEDAVLFTLELKSTKD